MDPRCESTRARLTGTAGQAGAWPAAVREHVAGCAPCAEYARVVERVEPLLTALRPVPAPAELEQRVSFELGPEGRAARLARHVRALPQHPAPRDLDGRVVAALHAGRRQDRAVEVLRSLHPVPAPAALEGAVAARLEEAAEEAGLRAPRELERRVAADLRASFRRRVERLAQALGNHPGAPAPRAEHGARRGLALGVAASLVAVLLGWALGLGPLTAPDRQEDAGALAQLPFEVEPAPLDGLEPQGVELLARVTGGLASALPPAARELQRLPLGRPATTVRPAEGPTAERGGEAPLDGGAGALPPAGEGGTLEAGSAGPLLALLPDAPVQTRYSGRRRVTLTDPGTGARLVLLERVSSDGAGRFSVDPVEVLEAPADSPAQAAFFRTQQKAREGFFFRYRDFRVRDLARFQDLWVAEVLAEDVPVAGRLGVQLDVRRADSPERHYLATIDVETGLVLRFEERLVGQPDAPPLMRVEFETLELGPELELPALSSGPSEWLAFDPEGPPPPALDFPLRRPSFVPDGYVLDRAATRSDTLGGQWVEFRYGDGVEELVFLHTASATPSLEGVPAGRVRVASLGSWTVVEGEIDGVPMAAIGRVHPQDLLLLVHSAFE